MTNLRTCVCGCGSVIDTSREGGWTVYIDRGLNSGDPKAKLYYVVGHTPFDRARDAQAPRVERVTRERPA